MSLGSSTTQITVRSRRASWQIGQSGPSARLKHSSQKPIRSLTSRMASASASASSGLALRMWKASRCAVRRPIPGSRASWTIRFSTDGEYTRGQILSEAGDAQAARAAELAHHPLLLELLRGRQRTVERRDQQVLEHLRVVRVDCLGLDRDLAALQRTGDLDGDRAAARRVLDVLGL